LTSIPASKTLLPEFFKVAGISISKREYYLVAQQMRADEVASEIRDKLDGIQQAFHL